MSSLPAEGLTHRLHWRICRVCIFCLARGQFPGRVRPNLDPGRVSDVPGILASIVQRTPWHYTDLIRINRQKISAERCVPMRHSRYLALLGLLLLIVSCARQSAQVRPAEPPKPDAHPQAAKVATEEVKPAPKPEPATRPLPLWALREDKTSPVPAEPRNASAAGQAAAKAEKLAKDTAPSKDDPETEQKKIEDALDLYQEGVDAWVGGNGRKRSRPSTRAFRSSSASTATRIRTLPSRRRTSVSSSPNGSSRSMPPGPTSIRTSAARSLSR